MAVHGNTRETVSHHAPCDTSLAFNTIATKDITLDIYSTLDTLWITYSHCLGFLYTME